MATTASAPTTAATCAPRPHRRMAAAPAHKEVPLAQGCDVPLRVQDLNIIALLDVVGGDLTGANCLNTHCLRTCLLYTSCTKTPKCRTTAIRAAAPVSSPA